jgi:hypothetical protein
VTLPDRIRPGALPTHRHPQGRSVMRVLYFLPVLWLICLFAFLLGQHH